MILKDVAITGYDQNKPTRKIGVDSYPVDGLFVRLSKGLRTKDFNKVNIILLEVEGEAIFGYPIQFGVPENTFGIIKIYIKFDYKEYSVLNRIEKQVFFWNIITETFTKYLLPKIEDEDKLKDILKKGRVKIEAGEI